MAENKPRRIALATTDGLTLHQHFGRARSFRIAEYSDGALGSESEGKWSFIEQREVSPPCSEGGHSESAFDAIIDTLKDCELIVVGKIGPGAAEYMAGRGVRVIELPGALERVLPILARKLTD